MNKIKKYGADQIKNQSDYRDGGVEMIKIEKTEVYGWEAAIRGMRNPMNSWEKSDSDFSKGMRIGENDLKLMKKLSAAGNDHGKYLRTINVTCDITAPLYWWKEFDTYKVGTVANSCSTMHKIHAKEFTLDDFSCEHLFDGVYTPEEQDNFDYYDTTTSCLIYTIQFLNFHRKKYIATKEKRHWWQMIQLLPSSYNQKRTVQLNYQVLKNMYGSRKNHKLDEWRQFCEWIESLPYAECLIFRGEGDQE